MIASRMFGVSCFLPKILHARRARCAAMRLRHALCARRSVEIPVLPGMVPLQIAFNAFVTASGVKILSMVSDAAVAASRCREVSCRMGSSMRRVASSSGRQSTSLKSAFQFS